MDLDKVQRLVKMIEESSLTEFTYEDENINITMSKNRPAPEGGASVLPMMPYPGQMYPQTPLVPQAGMPVSAETEKEEEPVFINAPIVGTFYSAPAPDADAYVKVGDHVKNGQTVCILEAMKLMNEIQADFDCEIETVLVSNEQKVEYGQPLFRVKKL